MSEVRRDDIGVWIGSTDYDIQVTPVNMYPREPESLFVRVYARPVPPGQYLGLALHDDKQRGFRFDDISISDTRLECVRHHEYTATHKTFRKGFSLELAPDMIEALRAWLPPLRRIARVARAIAKEVETARGRVPTRDEQSRIGRIVSARVFGACDPEWSVTVGQGYAPQLEVHLQTPVVMALLATCGTDFKTLAKGT